ncbi:MAG: hypothetical protein GY856_35050 [bacterium]|nr:hypothetical protein [bacterium]
MAAKNPYPSRTRAITVGLICLTLGFAGVWLFFGVMLEDGIIGHEEYSREPVRLHSVHGLVRAAGEGALCLLFIGFGGLFVWLGLFPRRRDRVDVPRPVMTEESTTEESTTEESTTRTIVLWVGIVFLLPGLLSGLLVVWSVTSPESAPSFIDDNAKSLIGLSSFVVIGIYLLVRSRI